jgi:hypothetical protein
MDIRTGGSSKCTMFCYWTLNVPIQKCNPVETLLRFPPRPLRRFPPSLGHLTSGYLGHGVSSWSVATFVKIFWRTFVCRALGPGRWLWEWHPSLDWPNAPSEWRALVAVSLISLATGICQEVGCGHPIESRAIRSACHNRSVQATYRTSPRLKIPVNISLW